MKERYEFGLVRSPAAPFDEILFVRHGLNEVSHELMATSTLLPILLVWTATIGIPDAYTFIREKIVPEVPEAAMNFWSTDVGFDGLVADPRALHEHGVGEIVSYLPSDAGDFLRTMSEALPGVQSIEDAVWYQLRCAYVPLLAALHWNTQVPREMLVKQAIAVAAA